jgi:hypothetical protein
MERHGEYVENVQRDLEDDLIKRNREKSNFMLEMSNTQSKLKEFDKEQNSMIK